LSSIALYFVDTYQIILDKTMMGNVFNTDMAEATDLFHFKILSYILIFGIIPSLLILKIKIQNTKRLKLSFYGLIIIVISLGWIYLFANTWLWFDKNSKILGGKMMPWSYIVNSIANGANYLSKSKQQTLLPDGKFADDEKMLVVLIIGETARAHNFSLYGYKRQTNPKLSKTNITVLKNSTSCSTYTTKSIACMLSHNNDSSLTTLYENLPSYLQRQGADTIWRTKNWGEPELKVQTYQRNNTLEKQCKQQKQSGCDYDEVLLTGLKNRILSSKKQKIFVVLHTKGSHGPSYNTQYPPEFEKYIPVCKSVELSKCSNEELINAYDNTIFYTDYFINKTINKLKDLNNIPSMLIYASDHGESLGEYGLYLHGTPYSIAPDYQTKIPFMIWLSTKFKNKKNIKSIVQKKSHSHQNIFHTIIGAYEMQTKIYQPKLDILKPIK